jgi:mannose-6-phosphate isomerase-like protein (cupin superfamily)
MTELAENFINHQDEKVIKPWGEETIYTDKELKYTLKLLTIKKGCRISLQSHTEKIETFVLIDGEAQLVVGTSPDQTEIIDMVPRKGYSIPVNTVHRMIAGNCDAFIMEGSTPETGVTIRYQDDYNRPDETEEMRQMANRGWNADNQAK